MPHLGNPVTVLIAVQVRPPIDNRQWVSVRIGNGYVQVLSADLIRAGKLVMDETQAHDIQINSAALFGGDEEFAE